MVNIEPLYCKSDVPEGTSGEWLVEKFEVAGPPPDPGSFPEVPEPYRQRPGNYTRLKRGYEVFMTDLYDEWWTQKEAMEMACNRGGHILITGLGLGVIVESVLRTPGSGVERVTVVEASSDVVQLVAPHLLARYGEKLNIVHADALHWNPPPESHYTVGWHDIWPNPEDYRILPEMDRLEERYSPYCDWQACWGRERVEARPELQQEA